jgi:hypothetical protein
MIFGIDWTMWLTWLLAAFFIVNGVVNWFGPKPMLDGYARWGFPGWFHRFNGTVQLGAGVLLLFPVTFHAGIALGLAVCLGIFATLIRHKEFSHLPPGVILFALLCVGTWARL